MRRKAIKIKNHLAEVTLFKQRAWSIAIFFIIFAVFLMMRLAILQIKNHELYSTLSQHNLLNIIPIEPARGLIYDRNGVVLAKNIPSYTLTITPSRVANLDATIQALQQLIPSLTDQEVAQFNHLRNQFRPFQPIPLKLKLSEADADTFYVNQFRFPGVAVTTQLSRYYPLAETVSNVVGYVGRINPKELTEVDNQNYTASDEIGKMGIEKYYENVLHGRLGAEEAETDASGHVVRILKEIPPVPGSNLYLTIDSRLQAEAEKVLGDESGSIVMINPANGEVLALVTHPNYDPNPFVSGINNKDYQTLVNSPQHPLYNRAIRGQFASGSTIKPFFALAGLDNGIITPTTKIYDRGLFQIPNTVHIYHDWDWNKGGHGWVNVVKAITVSCDVFFYNLAMHAGIDSMDKVLHEFGFGQFTGIDMPEEVPGLVPSPSWKRHAIGKSWYPGDTVETGIGQGFLLVTPLQLANATAILANRGQHFQPHLLQKSLNTNGVWVNNPIIQLPPVVIKNAWAWDVVTQGMQGVVDSPQGTATLFGPHPDFTVAAKTGTAQVYGGARDENQSDIHLPKQLRNNHLIVAYAPVDHPQVAIAVLVEHSPLADKMGGELLNYYFHTVSPIQHVTPTTPAP